MALPLLYIPQGRYQYLREKVVEEMKRMEKLGVIVGQEPVKLSVIASVHLQHSNWPLQVQKAALWHKM